MFSSIIDDIKATFSYGNMVSKIIIVNVGVYMVFALFKAFFPEIYASSIHYFMLPSDVSELFLQPWSLVTHMFLHEGFWHLLWNMVMFYTFGNIMGDLLGDQRVLPTYLLGGLGGAIFYVLGSLLFHNYAGSYALGASAAILSVVICAIVTAPDYMINLILIGPVRIKYVGLFLLFFDIVGAKGMVNSGGSLGHLGGSFMGFLLVYLLRNGYDLTRPTFGFRSRRKQTQKPSKSAVHLRVVKDSKRDRVDSTSTLTEQDQIDNILDKINKSGYSSLSEDEKIILKNASKDN
jgi:membrane associated rhomboid family serine protease